MDRHRSESGLSLIEVLISLGVVAFIMLSLIAMLSASMQLGELAEKRSVATSLAADRIERITSQPFRPVGAYAGYALPGETAADGPPITITADYGDIPGYPDYRRVVTLLYDVPVLGMLTVETDLSWDHQIEGERTQTLVLYINPGRE